MTPLHRSAAKACAVAQSALLSSRADANAKDGNRQTPLHLLAAKVPDEASMYSSENEGEDTCRAIMVKELVAHAADVNACDAVLPPLFLAASAGHCGVLRALLESDADVSRVDHTGGTVLHAIMS